MRKNIAKLHIFFEYANNMQQKNAIDISFFKLLGIQRTGNTTIVFLSKLTENAKL